MFLWELGFLAVCTAVFTASLRISGVEAQGPSRVASQGRDVRLQYVAPPQAQQVSNSQPQLQPQLRYPQRQPQQQPSQQPQTTQQQQQPVTPASSTANVDATSGDCGTPRALLTRIIGGAAAASGMFPWQAAVQRSDGSFCGGVIIDTLHVLTAAHCIASGRTYTVGAGSNDLPTAMTSGYSVGTVTVHPSFQTATLENDIAILTLTRPLDFANPTLAIGKVCLPQYGADVTKFTSCYVTGWGATSVQQASVTSQLQAVAVDIQTDQTCSSLYGLTFQANRFCAGDTVNGNKDSCLGDSGGPLVCYESGHYVLYGLVSSGISCAQPEFPGIYAEVANFVPWIVQNI